MGLEAFIEKDAREYAEAEGGILAKFVSPGLKGVPDRFASHINCGPFLIEFKAPKNRLDHHQILVCEDLVRKGFRVYTGVDYWGVNSMRMAREIIEDEFRCQPKRHLPLEVW